MPLTCGRCSRVNPAEAVFCYHDGALLGATPGEAASRRAFPNGFIFPSGRVCRDYDELALACHDDWLEARQILQQGFLESFFAGLGRADLAVAAREAARFPDPNRGLDQLLDRLPTDVLEPARLHVEPLEVSLGILEVGKDQTFPLQLDNQGMRLVYGTAAVVDTPWLVLGEGAGVSEKHFQFNGELTLPVRVCGDRLRASPKPQQGRLVLDSNGGRFTVLVKAEVPIRPFPEGVLAGALTPRQLAEKAKTQPREAALLFEKGAVAKWYQSNGWIYPVKAQASSGLGAVQQFFEALGLTAAPKVEISEKAVTLRGKGGESLRHALTLTAQEKRPVWVEAKSDQPWLEIGRPQLNGQAATVTLAVPSIPRTSETLTAQLTLTTNGNQRFVVPVTLTVEPDFAFADMVSAPLAQPVSVRPPSAQRRSPSVHALPALLLGLLLAGAVGYDAFFGKGSPDVPEPFAPVGDLTDTARWYNQLRDREPRLGILFDEANLRFGLVSLGERDPNNPSQFKRLFAKERGSSNNTCVRINDAEYLFGPPGSFSSLRKQNKPAWFQIAQTWQTQKVTVTQLVLQAPGETRLLDTCLVVYTVENRSEIEQTIGLRVMLDTFIGSNDGVPFSIPGRNPPLVSDKAVLEGDAIPDYIQALERPDPANPGTFAHLGLRGLPLGDVESEAPDRVIICRWPEDEHGNTRWQPGKIEAIDIVPEKKDSCLFIYWPYRPMKPGEVRTFAYTYGLSSLSGLSDGKSGNLALYAPTTVRAGEDFSVTAYVKKTQPGQRATLKVPEGFTVQGEDEVAVTETGSYGQASWRVRAGAVGEYTLEATSGSTKVQRGLRVGTRRSLFD